MVSKPRVLFIMWRSMGHINAAFGVAKRLKRLGFEVVFIGPTDIRERVQLQEYMYYECEAFEGMPIPIGVGARIGDLLGNIASLAILLGIIKRGRDEAKQLWSGLNARVRAFVDAVQEIKPDLLIFDPFLLYFYIAVHELAIPTVALSTKSLATPSIDVPPYNKPTIPNGSRGSRLLIGIQWLIETVKYRGWLIYRDLFFGISPLSLCKTLANTTNFPLGKEWATRPFVTDLRFRSVREWVLYPPVFDFPRDDVASGGAAYVGGCVDVDRLESDFICEFGRSGRLLVCVLTSVFKPGSAAAKRRSHFIRQLLICMRQMPEYNLILSCGLGVEGDLLQNSPPNMRIYANIPALTMMRHADLLITQGGGNIVKEAILQSVNLLTFPDAADQPGLAARLQFHGLSRARPLGKVSAAEIRSLILESLSDDLQLTRIDNMRREFLDFEKGDIPLRAELACLAPQLASFRDDFIARKSTE